MIVDMAGLEIINSKEEPTRREQKEYKIIKSIIDYTIISKELIHKNHKVINGG